MTASHTWKFVRTGGFLQVSLEGAGDFSHLSELDPKLWAALACPSRGLELDERTLALLDFDHDGRIRVVDVQRAVAWITGLLRDPANLLQGTDAVALQDLRDDVEEARGIRAAATRFLAALGRPGDGSISLADVKETATVLAKQRFNGDGVIPPEAAGDATTRDVVEDIVKTVGGVADASGAMGVQQAQVDAFFEQARAFMDWWAQAEADPTGILPLGEETEAADAALEAVKAKIDDWFTRCDLAAFDPRAVEPLNRSTEGWSQLSPRLLTASDADVASFPLAHVAPGADLSLTRGLNPAWSEAMARFRTMVVEPLLEPRETLSREDLAALQARLTPFRSWRTKRPAGRVGDLGRHRVASLLDGSARASVESLLQEDEALKPEVASIEAVERLVRFHRDLRQLLDNFVSFRDFYGKKAPGVFQTGTLYLDNRSFDLCLAATDAARHGALASHSRACLVYCDCTRSDMEKTSIVAAVTDGDSDYLLVGRNGLFVDRKGRQWDAVVTKVVENPISIQQAFWTPYKRVARFVEEQVEKFAASADKAAEEKMSAGVTATTTAVTTAATPTTIPPTAASASPSTTPTSGTTTTSSPTFDVAKYAGIFAAIGLAFGAIATAVATVVAVFLDLALWQMPLAIAGALLVVSGPSMLLAWLKLRQRNLGAILDANGWAMNARLRLNGPFGRTLTHLAVLPPGSRTTWRDPYAEKGGRRITFLLLLLLVLASVLGWTLWDTGCLDGWLGGDTEGSESAAEGPPDAVPSQAPEGTATP